MSQHNPTANRRKVLTVIGIGVAGLGFSGTAAASSHEETFVATLTGDGIEPPVETNASGEVTLTVDTESGESRYEIYVDCLNRATHYTLSVEGSVISERDLEGSVTEGIVRDEVVAEGSPTGEMVAEGSEDDQSAEDVLEGLRAGVITLTVHTEQYPDGEIAGQFEPTDTAEPEPEEVEEEEPEEEEPEEEEEGEEDEEEEPETVTTAGDATLTLGDINVGENVEPDDEYVTLQNEGDAAIDFTGWAMQDRRDEGIVDTPGGASAYSFPSGFTLEAGASVQIFTGGDESNNSDDVLYWGIQNPVWNQEGDTVIVEDANGDVALEESYEGDGTNSIMGDFFGQLTAWLA
jgi:hypothetical protein